MIRWLAIAVVLTLCFIASLAVPLRVAYALLTNNQARAWEIAKGYDLLGNPVFNGPAGEYISQRANRAKTEGRRWGCVLCRLLDIVDPGHCAKSVADKQTVTGK